MMNDGDRFDDIIDEAAREYNRAPETPRAEMWDRIQAGRRRSQGTPASPVRGTIAPLPSAPLSRPDVVPIHGARRRPMWWAAAIAATLLLGVAIGRMTGPNGRTHGDSAVAQRSRGADSPRAIAVAPADTPRLTPPSGGGSPGVTTPGQVAALPNVRRPGTSSAASRPERDVVAERRAAEVALPYRLATNEHLAMTEALLVTLRADMKAGRRDTTVASWATNLLGTTRMLLDSPASKDVEMKKLLEDLELVLAQIARLPAASGDSTDLELIDRAVKQRQVLTRLRAIEPRT